VALIEPRSGWALDGHYGGAESGPDGAYWVTLYNVMRYSYAMLLSFGDKTTERVWQREHVRSFDQDLLRSAVRKLLILDAAEQLEDLTVPPGNRLEKLRGDRAGQHSIRINQQWRICFRWTAAGPEDVSIVDYH
jgi:proteic killer suppression protein